MLDLKYAPEGSRDLHGCMDRMLWGMPKKTFCLRLFFAIKKTGCCRHPFTGIF